MSDDFYQRQLRDQQWRMQQDMLRQSQQQMQNQQWNNQLWRNDQDASRALQKQLADERDKLSRQHDEQLREQQRRVEQQAQKPPAQPATPKQAAQPPESKGLMQKVITAATQRASEAPQQAAKAKNRPATSQPAAESTLETAISLGLDLLKSPNARTALPFVALGIKAGVQWLASRQQDQQQAPANAHADDRACLQCGAINQPSYKFCMRCGAKRS